jgi:hypothetical protein
MKNILISLLVSACFVTGAYAQGGVTPPLWFTGGSSTLADGTGEIDTTLENTRAAAAAAQLAAGTSADSAGKATIYGQALATYRNTGQVLSTTKTGTSAVDSFTCWTATGNVILTWLGFEITTLASQADLVNFCLDYNPGTQIVRLGQGKDINGLAVGMNEYLGLGTISDLLTDSLAYVSGVAASATAVVLTVSPWRLWIPDGTVIKLLMPGTNAAAVASLRVDVKWYPAEKGAILQ